MSRIVALTGGTGFIGKVLWRGLEKAGWTVRPLIRPTFADQNREQLRSTKYIRGVLQDQESLDHLVDGVEAVVHCAGRVRGLDPADFQQDNIEGVARIARVAAALNPPPRFLLISSLAAREPALSAYAWSKRQGEMALQEVAGTMPWITLRPPAVYGPTDKDVLPLFQWIQRGVGLQLGSSNARFSFLYVDDLATAVIAWLENGSHAGRAFELHDGRVGGYSWQEVFELIGGKKVFRFVIPRSMLNFVASINQVMANILRYEPILTYGKVQELRHPDWVCDNSDLTQTLGWEPCVTLPEGVWRSLHSL